MATMMYKASTFRLRSYKAYMRMIIIPVLGEKINVISNDFGKNGPTSNDHLNDDGYVFFKQIQVVTTAQKISLDFIAIFKCQTWMNTNI